MRTTRCLGAALAALTFLVAYPAAQPPDDIPAPTPDRFVYPLAPAKPAPKVEIDVSAAPDAREWAEQAQDLVREWFPHVCQLLATEDYKPPETIRLVFKPGIRVPAYASRDEITIKSEWIKEHPDDFGMVIHEMTHIIQSYPRGGDKPGWLVEGIADYIRWWRYEPEAPRTRINPDRAKYTDSYRTTAAFLAWASGRYDRGLVSKLDRALRDRKYNPRLWEESTGKGVDALWDEFLASVRERR